jgi:hypothetical protein
MTRKELEWLEEIVKSTQEPTEPEPKPVNRIDKNGEIEAFVIETEMAKGEV